MAFDLSHTKTRVLTCTGLVVGGAVVAGLFLPGIAPALAISLGNMAGGVLSSDFLREVLRRGKSGDLLASNDLTKLTGAAVKISLQQFASEKKPAFSKKEHKSIQKIGKALEMRWEELSTMVEWENDVEPVQGGAVASLIASEESVRKMTALEPKTWKELLSVHAKQKDVDLTEDIAKQGGEYLHKHFPRVVWELLKKDATGNGPFGCKAYAELTMTMLSNIQSRLPTAAKRDQETAKLACKLNDVIAKNFEQFQAKLDEVGRERHAELIESFRTTNKDISAQLDSITTNLEAVHKTTQETQVAVNELSTVEAKRHDEIMAKLRSLQKNTAYELLEKNESLQRQLEEAKAAINTLETAAEKGNSRADEALNLADPEKAQLALIAIREEKSEDVLELDRQIAAIAFLRGDINEAKYRLENILKEMPNDFDAINRLGHIHRLQGDWLAADASYSRLLEIADGNASKSSVAYGNLGLLYHSQGKLDLAEKMCIKSLDLSAKSNAQNAMACNFGNLGIIHYSRGNLDIAEKMNNKALAMHKELGCEQGMAVQYGNLGLIYQTRGDYNRAEEMHNNALTIQKELGCKEGMASNYNNLAAICKDRGDLERAETLYHKAFAINQELGRKEGMAINYDSLGSLYYTQGDLKRAETMHSEALAINQKIGCKHSAASNYESLGIIYNDQGNFDRAESMHNKSFVINNQLDNKKGLAANYCNLGLTCKTRGNLSRAKELYNKAIAIHDEIGCKKDLAINIGNLGNVYQMQGDFDRAEEMHKKALAINETIGRKKGMANQYGNLGNNYQLRGDFDNAEVMHKKSLAIEKELGSKEGVASQYANLGRTYQSRGDRDEALRLWTQARNLFEEIGMRHMAETVQAMLDTLQSE